MGRPRDQPDRGGVGSGLVEPEDDEELADVAEAAGRGHEVTAVVRDPGKYADLGGDRVAVVAGDVTDADSVATVAAGHDAAISAVYRADVPADEFYVGAANALLAGLTRAGVGRLVLVGIGTILEAAPGTLVHDTPGFPEQGRIFSLGHLAALQALQAATADVDWVMLAPPPVVLDDEAGREVRGQHIGKPLDGVADPVLGHVLASRNFQSSSITAKLLSATTTRKRWGSQRRVCRLRLGGVATEAGGPYRSRPRPH